MKSMYFDDSLYENQMHYAIAKMLESEELDDDCEEIRIHCDSEEEYNNTLDALYHAGEGKIKMFGVTNMPFDIIVEKDIRGKYRKFDESNLLDHEPERDLRGNNE